MVTQSFEFVIIPLFGRQFTSQKYNIPRDVSSHLGHRLANLKTERRKEKARNIKRWIERILSITFIFFLSQFVGCASIESTHSWERLEAVKRLKDQTQLVRIALEDKNYSVCNAAVEKLAKLGDQAALTKIAIPQRFKDWTPWRSHVRMTAAERLTDLVVAKESNEVNLAEIVISFQVPEVQRAAFTKITNEAILDTLASQPNNAAVSLAANIRRDRLLWDEAIRRTDPDLEHLNTLTKAMDLFENNQDAFASARRVCREYIRQEDRSQIPKLIKLLDHCGNVSMAQDYLDGRHPALLEAVEKWAVRHGYTVKGSGRGYVDPRYYTDTWP